jgi:hypothetical protein
MGGISFGYFACSLLVSAVFWIEKNRKLSKRNGESEERERWRLNQKPNQGQQKQDPKYKRLCYNILKKP